MSPPFGVIGLSYGGNDLQALDMDGRPRIFLEIVLGLFNTPEVRGTDSLIPHRDWLRPRTRRPNRRQIVLSGFVMGGGDTAQEQMDDFNDAWQSLQSWFDPSANPADLVASLQDGSTATIAARALPPLNYTLHGPGAAELGVELEAANEDWSIEAAPS